MKTIRLIKKYMAILVLLFSMQTSEAQDKPLHYWRQVPAMMNEQATLIFDQADQIFARYPPTTAPGIERKLALYSLDAVLHDPRLDNGPAFSDYMTQTITKITQEIQKSRPKSGLKIFKLYNQAFIVQSPTATMAFDLVSGGKKDSIYFSNELMEKLVAQCDVLFISHKHGDHADESVAAMFAKQNKLVVAPKDALQGKSPFYKLVQSDSKIDFDLPLKDRLNLSVTIFPGHQDEVVNNLYVVRTPEGTSVMHTGDQHKKEDMPMLSTIKESAKVDVLLLHCWIQNPQEVVTGISPQLVITGHENEMGHKVDHREPYWLTFRRMKAISRPSVVMAWGEHFHFNN